MFQEQPWRNREAKPGNVTWKLVLMKSIPNDTMVPPKFFDVLVPFECQFAIT